jgi:hypothetical protein
VITYPAGSITPYGAWQFLRGDGYNVSCLSYDKNVAWQVMGGRAPITRDGVTVKKIKGLLPTWQMKDQKGSNQHGVTFNKSLYDPIVIDMPVEARGATPAITRKIIRDWIDSWDPTLPNQFSFDTTDMGRWWANARWFKSPTDDILGTQHCKQPFLWTTRIDDAFWRFVLDCADQFPEVGTTLPAGGAASGYVTLTNIGTEVFWPDFLFYGPGTVSIGNGPNSQTMIPFGPLLDNQIALIRTNNRKRGVYDLSPTTATGTTTQLNQWQQFLQTVISLATNGNVPPLLQQFESYFGIPAPQGPFYSLLGGRFTTPLPKKPVGGTPVESNIAVQITGGNSATKLIAYGTPLRRWPA